MSFKDLTARAAAAMKPKVAETAETPAISNKPEAAAEDTKSKSKKR